MTKKQMLLEQELMIRTDSRTRRLHEQLKRLGVETPISTLLPTSSPAINNLVDNGDFNWSDDAYRNAGITPATAGDPNNRAYNWYRIQRATALLVEDDAHSLKGSAHSLFASESGDAPRWSKTNGWAELGEIGATPWDICCPLPNNFVIPGMRFYLQMLLRIGTATVPPADIKFFWMLYDNTNTAPAPQVIKGTAFTLDGAVFGPTGATTRDYKLIVDTDYGNQVESTVKSIANAPAALTPTNGVALSWPRYPGFTRVSIYVTVGGSSFLVGIIGDGSAAFNDVGQVLGPVASVPTVTDTQAKAYAETRPFTPTENWEQFDFSIIAPHTYDFSQTTGKQWLRGGVLGLMGDSHQLQIDRIGLSTGFGVWAMSSRDATAASRPSTSQTSSTQGPPTGGGIPPGDGEGVPRSPTCAVLDTPYMVSDEDGLNARQVDLRDIHIGMFVRGLDPRKPNKVTGVRRGYADVTVEVRTANGFGRRCSLTDRWLTSLEDRNGTPVSALNVHDAVLTIDGLSEIVRYALLPGADVGILSTDGDHVLVGGGAMQHNMAKTQGL